MPLKSRASEARAARTKPEVEKETSPAVEGPSIHTPSGESVPEKKTRKGRAPSPEVAARRANEKRLAEILTQVRKVKVERQAAITKVTQDFDSKLKQLQDEHNRLLFS